MLLTIIIIKTTFVYAYRNKTVHLQHTSKEKQNNQTNKRQQQIYKQKQSSLVHCSAAGQCIALLNSNGQSLGKIAIGHVIMSKGSYS